MNATLIDKYIQIYKELKKEPSFMGMVKFNKMFK